MNTASANEFGRRPKDWRRPRGRSQLNLALETLAPADEATEKFARSMFRK